MTPSVIESHLRSRRFHAEIARRAALVPQREDRTYFIPNTPFGVKKIQPSKIIPHVPEPNYLCCMWFYDLVFSNPKRERAVLVSDIQHAACRLFNISLNDMIADRRFTQFVRARQIAMYMAKVYTPRSLPEIGRRFGGRDHTTVLHAVRKIGKLVETNPDVAADVAALRVELGL